MDEGTDRLGVCQFVTLKVLIFDRAYTHGTDFQLCVCPLYQKVAVKASRPGNIGTVPLLSIDSGWGM